MKSELLGLDPIPVATPKEFLLRLSYNVSCFLAIYAYQLNLLVPKGEWFQAQFFDLAPIVPLALTFLLSPIAHPPFSPKVGQWINRLPNPLALAFGPALLGVLFIPPIAVFMFLVNFDNPYAYNMGNGITSLVAVFGVIIIVGEIIVLLRPQLLGESEHVFMLQEYLPHKVTYNIFIGAISSFMLTSVLIFALDRKGVLSEYSDLYGLMALVGFVLVMAFTGVIQCGTNKSLKQLGVFKSTVIGEMLWYASMLLTYGGAKLCQKLF